MKKTRFSRPFTLGTCVAILLLTALQAQAGGAFMDAHLLNLPRLHVNELQTIALDHSAATQIAVSPDQVVCNRATCTICNPSPQGTDASNRSMCTAHGLNTLHECGNHPDHNPMQNDATNAHWQLAEQAPPAAPAGWKYERVLLASLKYTWRLVRTDDATEAPVMPIEPTTEQLPMHSTPVVVTDLNYNPVAVDNLEEPEDIELQKPEAAQVSLEAKASVEEEQVVDSEKSAVTLLEYDLLDEVKGAEAKEAESTYPSIREVIVWPNPSQGQFRVRLDNPLMTPVHFEVLDPTGKVVARKDSDENAEASFDLHRLAAGVYQIVAYSGRGQDSKQILIRR